MINQVRFFFIAFLIGSQAIAAPISPRFPSVGTEQSPTAQDSVYTPNTDGDIEDLLHDAYVYQVQPSRFVNWMYIGYAPRLEDPSRITIVMSKRSKTMRVSLELTKAELAAYPEYLVRKAGEVEEIVYTRNLQFYQQRRVSNYLSEINQIRRRYNMNGQYSNNKASEGFDLLSDKFPSNVFQYSGFESRGANEVAAIAHFVYPITVHRSGTWPSARDYRMSNVYSNVEHAIQERRSTFTRGTGRRVSDIFGGFPAFWIDGRGAGKGVHGPIRYSSIDETRSRTGQRGPYGPARNQMWRFWQENEFLGDESSAELENVVRHRWEVVRTRQSKGCFRAETMELRHLLPSNRRDILTGVVWRVIDQIDRVQTPEGEKYVDVNYYMLNPYSFPPSRQQWIQQELGMDPQTFINEAWLFDYLAPETVEFTINGQAQRSVMGELNRAGGATSL